MPDSAQAVVPMISIEHLESSSPGRADPGSLLLQVAKAPAYAAWLIIGGGGPRNALIIDNGPHGFKVVDGRAAYGSFVRVGHPRFVVDPASGITGTDGSPEPGTLFRTPEGPGILARLDHAECRVLLDGRIREDTGYAEFAGFRHWRIEVDGPDGHPVILFTYRHRSMDPKE